MTTATMPRITDSTRVHSVLNLDRAWAAYAIGDLAPEFAADCSWYAPDDGSPALLLLYRGFDPAIAFAMGEASQLAPLFGEMDASKVSLHVRSDAITALLPAYRPTQTREMWRMVVDPASFRSVTTDAVVALDESDLAAISALYEDGRQHDETPTFFYPWMLRQGTFRGIREGSDLIAVAGTHLYSQELGVCAVGNVYTRRDRRRRGLGARVTSAVVEHAMSHAIPTIVLNVGQRNRGARRLYEQLGFRCHCDFLEGEPRQRLSAAGSGETPSLSGMSRWQRRMRYSTLIRWKREPATCSSATSSSTGALSSWPPSATVSWPDRSSPWQMRCGPQ